MSMKNNQQQQQQQQEQDQEAMDHHKNPNLETTHNHNHHHLPPLSSSPSSSSQDLNKTHQQQHMMSATHTSNKTHDEDEVFTFKNVNEVIKNPNFLSSSSLASKEGQTTSPPPPVVELEVAVTMEEESGRERLKRHRVEMAGRVRIPDIWGHEDLLKDWIDCTVFDSSLGNKSIMSARAALIQERRSTLRI